MSGSLSEDSSVGRVSDRSGQRYQSGEALAEWRSCEHLETGAPSTSTPYWDIDDVDDCGPKPSELYGRFTWKIEKFSQTSKRELRSNVFEIGGYKWYILVYPQGCDVCNHLSLFLCVANHDKLLPGWSHFAQFTIAVLNKDQKKTKYSDTLHRFWKKEHDWGWKKFMELSKVVDGFIVDDSLEIKAQVQVIREKADRPFRCLDFPYRTELVRVYLSNVEQICRQFVDDKRGKLGKLIEDKVRWSSFSKFWSGVEKSTRLQMSREKTDVILKVVVKQFFVEKEVTSTLVMDSLYSGLKALECQSRNKKGREKVLDIVESPTAIVFVESDMFTLVDDVLLLLERAAREPLPPKDEKGPQNRTKDGSPGEDANRYYIERDERRLTELGRRTVEIFVLTHIFSNKIEIAYQEAVSLERQEELIREEEEAWQAENEQKAKRGAAEKEKRANKKKNKQRRGSNKGKDKGRSEKLEVTLQDKPQNESSIDKSMEGLSITQALAVLEKPDSTGDVSDETDATDDVTQTLQHDVEVDVSQANGQVEKKSTSLMDDSSSTCSTDSVPSVKMNGSPYNGNSAPYYNKPITATRRKNLRSKEKLNQSGWSHGADNPAESASDSGRLRDPSGTSTAAEPESLHSLKDKIRRREQHLVSKEKEVSTPQKPTVTNLHVAPDQKKNLVNAERTDQKLTKKASNGPTSQDRPFPVKVTSSDISHQGEKVAPMRMPSPRIPVLSKPEARSAAALFKPALKTESPTAHQVSSVSRPSSVPLVSGSRPASAVVPVVSTEPQRVRALSAAGRVGTETSPATQSYAPPSSYRNAIIGEPISSTPPVFTSSSCSSVSRSSTQYGSTSLMSQELHLSQNTTKDNQEMVRPRFTFQSVTPESLQNTPPWTGEAQQGDNSILLTDIQNHDFSGSSGGNASASARQYEFPHLDMINYLFDEDRSIGMTGTATNMGFSPSNGYHQNPQVNVQESNYRDDGGLQLIYGSSSTGPSYAGFGEAYPGIGLPHSDGQIVDGVNENQWRVGGPDLSSFGYGNIPGDGYLYGQPSEYSNIARDFYGNPVFRPANGSE